MIRPLQPKEARLARLTDAPLDLLVVGGGITGIGIALEAAARGKNVGLVEKNDWASATSSASSRLIHGGLRYLEHGEYGLVRESCIERARLLDNAAGWVWPERFCFPTFKEGRVGRFKLAAGLGLYTLVSTPRALGLPSISGKNAVARAVPGVDTTSLTGGGFYLDGATDDSRLAIAALATALDRGAICVSRVELTGIERGARRHTANLVDRETGESHQVEARAIVLAAGPFTDRLRDVAGLDGARWVQPTRGTHLVVPREKLPIDGAVIFDSQVDGRVMFLIPWPRYTVIGTTDLDATPDDPIRATKREVRYLLDSANALVPNAALTDDDVVSTWAGLRPLLAAREAEESARSREERVDVTDRIYTIAGGKLTGFRSMAESIVNRISKDEAWGLPRSNTSKLRLRGALPQRSKRPEWSTTDTLTRDPLDIAWERRYAGLVDQVDRFCSDQAGGRRPLDAETIKGEILWATNFEDCRGTADFLFRRTDLAYGPRNVADKAMESVQVILASRLRWSERRRIADLEEVESALTRLHAWRYDPD